MTVPTMHIFARRPRPAQRGALLRSTATGGAPAPTVLQQLRRGPANQATQRLLLAGASGSTPQTASVKPADSGAQGSPGRYEREADRAADQVLHQRLAGGIPRGEAASSTAGAPLPAPVREAFEARFGRDLSAVRVHADPATAEAVAEAGARALTVGSDIAFAPRRYAPREPAGLQLLAHEVAHVAQQGHAPILPGRAGRNLPNLTRRPAADTTAQPTLEVDPAKFSGAGASRLGMNLTQFEAHIATELSTVTGQVVDFQGHRLRMAGNPAQVTSSTAVRVLRLALGATEPYYIDPVPGSGASPLQTDGRRGIELGTGPFPPTTLRAMRRGITIIHELAHVFAPRLAPPGHAQSLQSLRQRYDRSLVQGRLTGSFTTEELGRIFESGFGSPISQEIIPVDISNRVRSELGLGIRRITYRTPIQIGGQVVEFAQFLVEGSQPPQFIYQRLGVGELLVSNVDFMQRLAREGRPATPGASELRPIAQFPNLQRYLQ